MKLKIKNVNKRENKVERFVARWANSLAADYDTGALGALKDLAHGGCASGMMGGLIYTADIVSFFKRHAEDVLDVVGDYENDIGEPLSNKDSLDKVTLYTWSAVEIVGNKLLGELES